MDSTYRGILLKVYDLVEVKSILLKLKTAYATPVTLFATSVICTSDVVALFFLRHD
jgi:hypothetical protein